MFMTSRDLVKATLNFENKNGRAPRGPLTLQWAWDHEPEMAKKIERDFPNDFAIPPVTVPRSPAASGNPAALGKYTDDWGCIWTNLQKGIMGEVKDPLVAEEDWSDWEKVHIPTEYLEFDPAQVNDFCRHSDQYTHAGFMAGPFEKLQAIRTPQELFVDLADPPENLVKFMDKMFAFYCEGLEKWAKTDVDSLICMDDWGGQNTLLINPQTWVKYFKPFYKEFVDIAHRHGKAAFFHSCGNILMIMPHLIELGVDSITAQIFCMGLDNLAPYKGKITFLGEVDRQHILPYGTVEDVRNAVYEIKEKLWDNGGCIAQCEFGPGAKRENVYTVYETWDKILPGKQEGE